ncbi:MAG: relaxase/mobilization nuclease domain-containing protein [Clostridia bacterium]|nr:relaxase/mobilization nuclease domain-containing protein [Clostridia bacterium]
MDAQKRKIKRNAALCGMRQGEYILRRALVIVHLNTDNLHCHFVVNSVSFKDGSKFGNHQKDHIKLREISDQVCREYGISVLENSNFWKGQSRGAYWYKKQGGMTHRDMLKYDIEYILPTCGSRQDFKYQMEALGYTFGRTDEYYAHTTITAPGWKRPIRLDSLGYSREVLDERINTNWDQGVEFYAILRGRIEKWRTTALEDEVSRLEFAIEHSYDTATVLVDTLFLILITVLQMAEYLMSPDLRHEARNTEQYVSDYRFLQQEEIHTIPQLEQRIADTKADNTRRRAHTPEEVQAAKDERKAITEKIRPLREKVKRAEKIMEKSPHLYELLQSELDVERQAGVRARNKNKERNYE